MAAHDLWAAAAKRTHQLRSEFVLAERSLLTPGQDAMQIGALWQQMYRSQVTFAGLAQSNGIALGPVL